MRVATGVDIISLQEVAATLQSPAQLQRMLLPADITRQDPEHIAGRIALKEAVIKALGLKPGSWLDIRISTSAAGKPVISVLDTIPGLQSLDGSISHHGDTAVAFVVALFNDED